MVDLLLFYSTLFILQSTNIEQLSKTRPTYYLIIDNWSLIPCFPVIDCLALASLRQKRNKPKNNKNNKSIQIIFLFVYLFTCLYFGKDTINQSVNHFHCSYHHLVQIHCNLFFWLFVCLLYRQQELVTVP